MTGPPTLSAAERTSAREAALVARRQRAAIRRALADGSISVAQVLDRKDSDPVCANLPVRELLASLPGVGRARCAGIMDAVGISATRRVRGLGVRQAAALRAMFPAKNDDDQMVEPQ